MKKLIMLFCWLFCVGCTQIPSQLYVEGCFNSEILINVPNRIIILNPAVSFFENISLRKSSVFFSDDMLYQLRKEKYEKELS